MKSLANVYTLARKSMVFIIKRLVGMYFDEKSGVYLSEYAGPEGFCLIFGGL